MNTERNLTHSEVFGHLEDKAFIVSEVFEYLECDAELFNKFVVHKTHGLFTKAFPPVTLKELREWKKENSIENSSREQSS